MKETDVPPEVAANFHLHEREWPAEDPDQQHAMLDAPFRFGDCPMDCLQAALNLARNSKTIIPAPQMPLVPDGVPVIAVGSGPSLRHYLDDLRSLQCKSVILASLSAVGGLRAEGIEPHYTVPIERTEDVIDWVPEVGEMVTFAGAPFIAKPVMDRFSRHCYMPDANSLCAWSSMPGDRLSHYGSSTGTASISMACNLTKGPVYLVGHDLAYEGEASHWKGAKSAPMTLEGTVPGNSGEELPSTWMWRRYRAMITELAVSHTKVVNTNILDRRGAVIKGTIPGRLPDPATTPDYDVPVLPPVPERLSIWQGRASALIHDVRRACRTFRDAKDFDGLDIAKAVPGPNGMMLAYILGSIYVQLSYDVAPNLPGGKSAISKAQALEWCRTATLSVLRESMGVFEEISEYGRTFDGE